MSTAAPSSSAQGIRIVEAPRHSGERVAIRGWVTHRRSSGKIAFIVLRDGSGQLQTVARIIAGRDLDGARRQVCFVSMGGFDNHDGLNAAHGGLMTQLGASVSAFQAAMTQLGGADKVTLFTGSDFGRTLTSNGDGSDHGWGSHHFVVGGAVRGGDV